MLKTQYIQVHWSYDFEHAHQLDFLQHHLEKNHFICWWAIEQFFQSIYFQVLQYFLIQQMHWRQRLSALNIEEKDELFNIRYIEEAK